MSIQRVFAILLLAVSSLPAHAGIFANVNVTAAQHGTWSSSDDGRTGLPFSGTLRSDLVLATGTTPCRTFTHVPGERFSMCQYYSDHTGIDSPYMAEYLAKFKTPVNLSKRLFTDLVVYDDGSYYGWFSFREGVSELSDEQAGTVQRSLDVSYKFWFEGSGMDPGTSIDREFALKMWREANFSKLEYSLQWYVLSLADQLADPIEYESWNATFQATTGTVPEPAAPLLFATGLLALIGQRAAKRRAGAKSV